MNAVQLHLALNHIPVLGVVFSLVLLTCGFMKKSPDIIRLSLWWLLGVFLLSFPAKFSGEKAYENVRNSEWADESLMMKHEKSADQAVTAAFLLGLASMVGLWQTRKSRALPKVTKSAVVILSILTFLFMARAAHSGGTLRHPEIRESHL